MKTVYDFETLGLMYQALPTAPAVLEAYSGAEIVQWHGNIERQIMKMISTYEAARNEAYTTKLQQFLRIWRDYQLTGSLNRETLQALSTATDILAVDNWHLQNYFSNLRDRLRTLIASEEELPRAGDQAPKMNRKPSTKDLAGEMPSDFGPDSEPPVDLAKDTSVPSA